MASGGGQDSGIGGRAAGEVRALAAGPEVDAALALRVEVFCGEQGVSREAELDGWDGRAVHLGAFEGGVLAGTCRLLVIDGEMVVQRVAVRAERRRTGVGRALIDEAVGRARAAGLPSVSLHAQVASEGFYGRQGFRLVGEPFLEEGIEHVAMRLGPLS